MEHVSSNNYLAALALRIHNNAKNHGFWESDRNFGEMIALMHSELSEALEQHRSTDSHDVVYYLDSKPEGAAVELIDCMIRILDTLHSMNVDIDKIMCEKMNYNANRPYKHNKAY